MLPLLVQLLGVILIESTTMEALAAGANNIMLRNAVASEAILFLIQAAGLGIKDNIILTIMGCFSGSPPDWFAYKAPQAVTDVEVGCGIDVDSGGVRWRKDREPDVVG